MVEEVRGCFSPGPCGAERGWPRAGRRAVLLRALKVGRAHTQLLFSSSSHSHPRRQEGYFPQAGANVAVPKAQKLLRGWGRWSSEGLAFLSLPTLQGQVCIPQPILYGTEEWHSAGQPGKLVSSAQPNHPISAGNLLQHQCATPDSARAPACQGGLLSLYTHFRTNLC